MPSATREITSSGVPHVFESALAVPWAALTHSSWAKLMLAEALLLNCTWMSFLDGLLQHSGCVQANSNFSQTRWQPQEGRAAFRIMRAKINLTPSRQAVCQAALQNKSITCSPAGWRTWTQFSEQLQWREQIGLFRKDFCAGYRKTEIITKWFNYLQIRFSGSVLLLISNPTLPTEVQ